LRVGCALGSVRPMARPAALALAVVTFALAAVLGCGDDADDLDARDSGPARSDGGRADAGSRSPVKDASGGEPDDLDDQPIAAADGIWTYVEFADSKCRDGSPAGIAVNLQSDSSKVMIFLQGGGACLDLLTCAGNPANVAGQTGGLDLGIFDRSHADNPVRDWNHVFVPYCTGDVHAGTKDDGMVAEVGVVQHFVGRPNLEKFLRRVVPTFADAEQVLLAGSSAGGFGSAINAELVQTAFGSVPVVVLDDSGPPMSSEYLPPCLQRRWRETWGLDESLLKDCGDDCPDRDDYTIDYMEHLAAKYPGQTSGLIETTADTIITAFFGYGADDCAGSVLSPVPAETFTAGLLDFRARVQGISDDFGTYYIEGSQHTWLRDESFYTQATGGVRLVDWVSDVIEGNPARHVGLN
jgi:hypothetical protein